MKIDKITTRNFDKEKVKNYLENYHIEDFYLKKLKIDPGKFIDFKLSVIEEKVKKHLDIWQIEDCGELIALIGIQKNESRSNNFGLNYFEFNPLYNFTDSAIKSLDEFERNVLNKVIDEKNIDYIKARINASDYFNISAFSKQSYKFIGTSLNLYLNKDDYEHKKIGNSKYCIESYTDKHKESVKKLILSHDKNEDFYDLEIDNSKVKQNFWNWFLEYSQKKNTEILILIDKESNSIIGFTCYSKNLHFSKEFNLSLITRDLTIIEKKYRGKGIAKILFESIMEKENKNVELKLMSNNYPALRFNCSLGFKIVSCHHYFSKKIEKR